MNLLPGWHRYAIAFGVLLSVTLVTVGYSLGYNSAKRDIASYLDRAESAEQRAELLRPVAQAIAEVAKNERQAALLIAQGWEDTKFTRRVLEYRCHEMPAGQRCDGGRSVGAFQVSAKWCRPSTVVDEARCALKAAGGGVARCGAHAKSRVHALFIGMAGSRVPCTWKPADGRAQTYRVVLARLRSEAGKVAVH